MKTRKILWVIFVVFAMLIGLYPLAYFVFDMSGGLLGTKSLAILHDTIWRPLFFTHISLGGIALLTGWSQFSSRIRARNMQLHRRLGMVYLVCVLLSGLAGLYIAFYASGGIIAQIGFTGLAIGWLFTTGMAYAAVLKRDIRSHENWMIRSYALCFAAVTLRLWLPLFQFGLGMDFFAGYRIIAWLCWVPNLLVAEAIIRVKAGSKWKLWGGK